MSQKDPCGALSPRCATGWTGIPAGIVAAGKSLAGSQMLSEVFRDRTVHKYYKCIVYGPVREARTVDGWLLKDPRTNQVKILSRADPGRGGKADRDPV